jgi:magnesium-protoporphyrin O-methyltransferase
MGAPITTTTPLDGQALEGQPMDGGTYVSRRNELEQYFDRTAVDAWAKLTSTDPVGRIRATVRAGRDEMRATLLSSLPDDLTGQRVLDAGCGTGALAVEAAKRGADVVAIDLSPTLIKLAEERLPAQLAADGSKGRVQFKVSDMLAPDLGTFDWVVAMDSLIHYRADDKVEMISRLAERATRGMAFTFAPRTPLLTLMWWAGKLFPRGNRSPAIEPIAARKLITLIGRHGDLQGMRVGRTHRVNSAFYISQSMELHRV